MLRGWASESGRVWPAVAGHHHPSCNRSGVADETCRPQSVLFRQQGGHGRDHIREEQEGDGEHLAPAGVPKANQRLFV